MNYFEMLGIDENTANEDAINEAFNKAQIKWQTILNQGIGEQAQIARRLMDGDLQLAYDTLIDETQRKQYKRTLDLQRERGEAVGTGDIRVNFTLGGGFGDFTFMVVENPVRNVLELERVTISSIQEYICRAWEDPELGVQTYSNRTLDRWVHYSAGDAEIANAIRFFRWDNYQSSTTNMLYQALDLLQIRYPVPILPRAPSDILEQVKDSEKPQWQVTPRVINFGLIPQSRVSIPVFIRWWKVHPGHLHVSCDNPTFQIETSKLTSSMQFIVEVDGAPLKRGEIISGKITLQSEVYGEVILLAIGARYKMMGNTILGQDVNLRAGRAALAAGDYDSAARNLKLAGSSGTSEARVADLEIIRAAYKRHDWTRVIEKVRQYHIRYGRTQETLLWLLEAIRVVGGTQYQLGQYERALQYLAAIAYESAYLQDKKLLASSWTAHAESQIRLNLADPKADWVTIAETLNLRWTHGEGSADQSKFAGPMPLELQGRSVVWITNEAKYKAPLIAYEGMIVVRAADNKAVVALDAASGHVRWHHTQGLTGKPISAPVVGQNSVYVTDPAGGLSSLDITTGHRKWIVQLKDSRDLTLAIEGQILCVGTGSQVILIDAQDGTELASTQEMRGVFGGGANPVNVLFTDGCIAFQKAVFGKQSLTFMDIDSGSSLEFHMPFSQTPPVTWAAHDGNVFVPFLVTKEMRCRYRDKEGKTREKVEIVWSELTFYVYDVRFNQVVADLTTPIGRYPTQVPGGCDVRIRNVQQANSCAVAPIFSEMIDGTTVISPPIEGQNLHRLVAAAFGRDIYYWVITQDTVRIANTRRVDSNVQSVVFANVHDMVVSATSLSTSLVGNTDTEDATVYYLPPEVRPISGTPALYGDVIYVVSRNGQVAAIAR